MRVTNPATKQNVMFTQRCFIRKNTKELVEKLKELGYNQSFSARGNFGDSLQTTWNSMGGNVYGFLSIQSDKIEEPIIDDINGVNCGTNEELFLAIASLRDDTDNMQWFTDGNGYWQLCIGSFKFPSLAKEKLHKATVQELIEHFNK